MNIRAATVRDVPGIAALITAFSQQGRMLFRSHAELYEALRDFLWRRMEGVGMGGGGGTIIGICALEIVWADLAEVRSLAVSPGRHGRGVGRALVQAVVEEAKRLEIQRVFALTYEQIFFEKLGFQIVDKAALPSKVWSTCIKCPKRDGCDEIAMVRTIFERSPIAAEDPDTHRELRYEVPTPLVQIGKVPGPH